MAAGKFLPRPIEENDTDIEKIRDPWFEEIFREATRCAVCLRLSVVSSIFKHVMTV